jgi:hypothetical protein
MGLRVDGAIDMGEIVSPSQTQLQMERKLNDAMNQLPVEMQGSKFVIDPDDVFA